MPGDHTAPLPLYLTTHNAHTHNPSPAAPTCAVAALGAGFRRGSVAPKESPLDGGTSPRGAAAMACFAPHHRASTAVSPVYVT